MNKIYVLEFNLFHSRFLRIHMSQKSYQEWVEKIQIKFVAQNKNVCRVDMPFRHVYINGISIY